MGIDLNEIEVEQQTYDAEISVIDDCKNLEVGKNENIEIKTDDVNEKEEQEVVIDINERDVEQQTDDAEISVTLEVEKNEDIEIKTDDVIEKEEKDDVLEIKTDVAIERE